MRSNFNLHGAALLKALLATPLLFGVSAVVNAQTVVGQDQMQVTANVLGQCTVQANDLNFPDYAQGSLIDVDAQTTIGVVCPNGTGFTVGLDGGLNTGLLTTRSMTGGLPAGTQLDYDLYTDAARTVVWGVPPGNVAAGVGAAPAAVTFDVFGQIPLGQSPNPGAFQDTVTAFVFF